MTPETPSSSQDPSRDATRIRKIRRRLVGATILLLLVLLIVPMLDSEPVIEEHSIQLDIPNPSPDAVPAATQIAAVSPTASNADPVIAQTASPAAQNAETPASAIDTQRELARIQQEIDALQAQKTAKETEQKRREAIEAERTKKQQEAKRQEEQKNLEAARKAEEMKRQEAAKKREAAQKAAQTARPADGRETWVASSDAQVDQTARAVAILEGRSPPASTRAAATGKRYVIQIGAYREKGLLEHYKGKVRGLGLTPFTEAVVVNGVEQTRLRVGPFESKDAADRGLKKLNSIGLTGPIVVR